MAQEQEWDREFLFKRSEGGECWEKVARVEKLIIYMADELVLQVDTRRELKRAIETLRLFTQNRLKKKQRAIAAKKAIDAQLACLNRKKPVPQNADPPGDKE